VEAISEGDREIGLIEYGYSNHTEFVQGRLRIGEAQSPPLIRRVKEFARQDALTIVDAPPGTACPVVAAVSGADFVVLVTMPTPFGLHDLRLAVELIRKLEIPFGVVVNRSGIGDDGVSLYCREERIPILLEIPDNRKIAEIYASGQLVTRAMPAYQEIFAELMPAINAQVA
jgi:MinD superfamily P-loop ATPase